MSPTRHFLAIPDFTRRRAARSLRSRRPHEAGATTTRSRSPGRTLGMIFAKSSTRTRVSFEVGAYQLGGHALFLSSRDIQLGRGEPIRDTARVLSRYLDGIMIRTYDHADVEELARFASHPGDQRAHRPAAPLPGARRPADDPGDARRLGGEGRSPGSATGTTWPTAGSTRRAGWASSSASPAPRVTSRTRRSWSETGSSRRSRSRDDPREAARGAHVVNTDVWASMGQEEEQEERVRAFQGYIVDEALMDSADRSAIFLHCLPAHRGEEVSESVIEGKQSRVWDQAENRLHVQKALMATLMGSGKRDVSGKGPDRSPSRVHVHHVDPHDYYLRSAHPALRHPQGARRQAGAVRRLGDAGAVLRRHPRRAPRRAHRARASSTSPTWASSRSPARTATPSSTGSPATTSPRWSRAACSTPRSSRPRARSWTTAPCTGSTTSS